MNKSLFYSDGIVIHESVVLNLFKSKITDSRMRIFLKKWHTRTIQSQIIRDVHKLQRGESIGYRYIDPNPQLSVDEEIRKINLDN